MCLIEHALAAGRYVREPEQGNDDKKVSATDGTIIFAW